MTLNAQTNNKKTQTQTNPTPSQIKEIRNNLSRILPLTQSGLSCTYY